MHWYNPFSQVLTNNIWPNVSTSQRAQNLTTDILVLNFGPKEYQAVTNSDSLWAGIIAPMFNKFTPLEEGPLLTKIKDYLKKVDFPVKKLIFLSPDSPPTSITIKFFISPLL